MITKKIKNILSNSYDQKSFIPIFNAINSVLFNLFKLNSLNQPLKNKIIKIP